MKRRLAVVLAVSACAVAQAVERAKSPARVCVKWSKELPDVMSAGKPLFASVARVDGKGPFPACDAVIETESFGVGWLMRAYMKEAVLSPCGKRLGQYSFHYKGDQWQAKLMTGLHGYLAKHPEALNAAKDCAPMTTIEISTVPAAVLPVEASAVAPSRP